MRLLETEAMGHDAATYIWPNGYIEPLLAVYKTKISSKITENLLIRGERKLGFILRNLPDVVYVPINRLTELDPDHYSVIDINTPEELKKSELILKKRVTQSS